MCSLQFNKVWKLFISLKIAGNKCPRKAENAILETPYFKILPGSRSPDPWLGRSWLDPPINLPLLWYSVRCINYTFQSMFATFRTTWDSTYQVTKKLHAIISTLLLQMIPRMDLNTSPYRLLTSNDLRPLSTANSSCWIKFIFTPKIILTDYNLLRK